MILAGLRQSLARSSGSVVAFYAATVAFLLYTCVYALRKAFAVATFEGLEFMGLDLKVWLVSAQVSGYALSKFLGIRIISELSRKGRATGILLSSTAGMLAWVGFALVPAPWSLIFLMINGLALGLIWGMIFNYLEGRKTTEVLGISLSASFIFSSGLSRAAGAWVISDLHFSEFWMPITVAAIFFLPLVGLIFLLDLLPDPSDEDIEIRTLRQPMPPSLRKSFLRQFWPGILPLVVAYTLLTLFRDFRDNFATEIWLASGSSPKPGDFAGTEMLITFIVFPLMFLLTYIRNHQEALRINLMVVLLGFVLIGVGLVGYSQGFLDVFWMMTTVGIGLYLGYIPFNSILFDRWLAAFRFQGTAGFMMYVADAFGYLGSVLVLGLKEFTGPSVQWGIFFQEGGYVLTCAGIGSLIVALFWLNHKIRNGQPTLGEDLTKPGSRFA